MPKNNHHFVPQSYLRNFSIERDAICLINIKRAHAVPTARIAGQCSRWKFHGETDELEDALGDLEQAVAPIMRSIISGGPFPASGTDAHLYLLFFLATQRLRTHDAAERMAHQASLFVTYVAKETGRREGIDIGNARIIFNDEVAFALSAARDFYPMLNDLDSRILRISCNARFITSDNPVIFYNQWCEGINYTGVIGAASSGLQIFYPLAPNCMIMLFDPNVYDVIGQKSGEILLTNPSDINHLNRLQCVFAQENLLFSYWDDREHILASLKKCTHLRNLQEVTLNVAKELINDPESLTESELLHGFIPMPDTHLKIKFSRVHRQARQVPLSERSGKYRDISMPSGDIGLPDDVENRLRSKRFVHKSTQTWRKD
jgi:hypothetical protein